MKREILLTEIIEFLGDEVIAVYGNPEGLIIKHLKAPQDVDEFTLDWVNDVRTDKQLIVEQSKAKAIIISDIVKFIGELQKQKKVLIVVKNSKLSIAKVGKYFFAESPEKLIHPSVIIHPEAIIGKDVFIGAHAVIGKCKIGDNVKIYPNVTIYDRTLIGNNVTIHAGAVICTDGLGCQRMPDGQLFEFPQLGGVIIEDEVYIGSNTQITSGSLSNTVIGKGSKINGLSFIGSNCQLGENTWITGSTMLAGSVVVGKNTSIFSKVVVRDQCHIGANATIGMGSVVTKNIPDNETWIGNPAKKLEK